MTAHDAEVERIARYMHEAVRVHIRAHEPGLHPETWDNLQPVIRNRYRAAAEAVIADRDRPAEPIHVAASEGDQTRPNNPQV